MKSNVNPYLTLNHSNAVLLGNLRIFRFLNQVSEHGQDDPGDFFLDAIAQDVGQNDDNIELVHFLSQ